MTLKAWSVTVAGSRGEHLVADVSLELRPGELLGLIGPNGAGKSSFLKALMGFKQLVGGAVTLDERPLAAVSLGERARRIAYLEQEGRIEWRLPVRDVVALGRRPHRGGFGAPTALDNSAIDRALSAVEMKGFVDAPATDLSAGERARVLLARALAVEASILLADEPTASLDPYHQLLVMETLKAKADAGGAVLVVLHDLALASRFLDRVVLMSEGAILAEGPPWKVLTDDNLAAVYRVAAVRGREGSAAWVLPWTRR